MNDFEWIFLNSTKRRTTWSGFFNFLPKDERLWTHIKKIWSKSKDFTLFHFCFGFSRL